MIYEREKPMNHQITLEELGIIPRQEQPSTEEKIDRSQYGFFCAHCICRHCANNVECEDKCIGEANFGCFTCDECKGWDGKDGTDNWKHKCRDYKVTDAYAKVERKRFRALRAKSEGKDG